MKKINVYAMLATVAVATFFSCAKEIEKPADAPAAAIKSHVEFGASTSPIGTRATLTPDSDDNTFEAAWTSTDKIKLHALSDSFEETTAASWDTANEVFATDFETATPTVDEDWIYFAKYPYAEDDGGNPTDEIPFGSARTQSGNNYNSAYDLMIGDVSFTDTRLGKDEKGKNFVIPMTRLTGIAYFHIAGGPDEDVLSATLTVSSGNIAAESVEITDGGTINITNGLNNITIEFPAGQRPKASDLQLWYNVLPGTYTGLSLYIKTATETASITSNKALTYTAGKLNKVVLSSLNWIDYEKHSIEWSSASAWADVTDGKELTFGDYTVTINKAASPTAPAINASALDARVYNGGTATVAYNGYAMSRIVFNISTQGLTRLAEITANVGTIATQTSGDDTVVWTGKAKEVTFTVGAKAVYGSDGASKAGQLDFSSVDVITIDDGLNDPGLSFPKSEYTTLNNTAFIAPELTNANGVSVVYSSSDTGVATVNPSTGAVSPVANGTATIKATFAGDATYRAATASYTLTVSNALIDASDATPEYAGYAAGSTSSFTVTANCEWEAVAGEDEDGIIDLVTISGNVVTVKFNANEDSEDKIASVIVRQTGALSSPVSKEVTVCQYAKPGAAAKGTVLWQEDFEAFSDGTQPTTGSQSLYGGGYASYIYSGTKNTKIYKNGTLGSMEILIDKSSRGETWTVSEIPVSGWTEFTLEYVSNQKLTINGDDITITDIASTSLTGTAVRYVKKLDYTGSDDTFSLVFSMSTDSNARLDNIVLKAGAPEAGITVTTKAANKTASSDGTTATLNGAITLVNGALIDDVLDAGFYYKLSSASTYTKVSAGSVALSFSKDITGLTTDSEYTYYAYAVYGGDEITGETDSFTPAKSGNTNKQTILSNANIVAAGNANNGYSTYTLTDNNGNSYSAYAIKNYHSKATNSYHHLQIKKYEKSTAYYIQIPELGSKITSITMTVSATSKPMTDGGNTATLYFSSSNSTSTAGTGVASGTDDSSVTIDASSLNLNNGYITASAGVRIWDITINYTE